MITDDIDKIIGDGFYGEELNKQMSDLKFTYRLLSEALDKAAQLADRYNKEMKTVIEGLEGEGE